MTDNYQKIVQENLNRLYGDLPPDLAAHLPARQDGETYAFTAFGKECRISPGGIEMEGSDHDAVLGILISLYALNARSDTPLIIPFKAYKEFPDTAPYAAAFASHTEQILIPHVDGIKERAREIVAALDGEMSPKGGGGDFSLLVRPLPKVYLCYIFYEADEDFPAAVTCLFSSNARFFLPVDGLADVGEYCSRTILNLIQD